MAEPTDRRGHPRLHVFDAAEPVFVTAGVLPRAALVYDASPGALGIVLPFAPPVGSILPIWLPGEDGIPSSLVFTSVIFVLPLEDDLTRVGTHGHDESSTMALREFYRHLKVEFDSELRLYVEAEEDDLDESNDPQ